MDYEILVLVAHRQFDYNGKRIIGRKDGIGMEYMVSVIGNVLGVLYQSCGASLVIAVLFMSVYMHTGISNQQAVPERVPSGILWMSGSVSNTFLQNYLGKSFGQCSGNLGIT